MTEDEMRDAGLARKARSIARLKEEGVPVIYHLPRIECDPGRLQHSESIARRTTVIALLAVYSEEKGMPREMITRLLRERGVEPDLTPAEVKYLSVAKPTAEQRGPFTWQYECAHVLLWAMGYVDALGSPTTYCTAAGVSGIVARRTIPQLMADAKLRTPDEIFDEADLIFRYHWAARDASLHQQTAPAGLIATICYYRHYALNWLTRSHTMWDEVDTST